MIEEAKKKIREEMDKCKGDSTVKEIGTYLLNNIEVNINAAKAIVKGEKNIDLCIKHMQSIALKRVKEKKGKQFVCIGPNEGFKIVEQYFKLDAKQQKMSIEENVLKKEQKNYNDKFSVNLDDLLN